MDNASFDEIVRKTMTEGSEAVPAGLWAGISQRAAAEAAGASGVANTTLWAGMATWIRSHAAAIASFATAACALVAAVIIWPLSHKTADTEDIMAEAVTVIEQPQDLLNATAQAQVPVRRRVKAAETANMHAVEAQQAEAQPVKEQAAAPQNATPVKRETVTHVKKEKATYQPMPEEVIRKKNRIDMGASVNSGGSVGNSNANGHAAQLRTSHDCGSEGRILEKDALSYMIPIKAGIEVRWNIGGKFAVGTGVNYTFLTRRLSGTYDNGAIEAYDCESITNNQHYIGIPVNLYFTFLNKNRFSMYATAGAAAERCVGNTYAFQIDTGVGNYNKTIREKTRGMQYSVNAGIGGQYSFTDHIALYVDPSICYFFPGNQPKSIRTTQPLQIGCDLGLRFNF